ncbi:hypothetical protein IC582_023647 [Cucumis melo]
MIPSSADRRCRMTRIRTSLGDFFLCICFFCFENYIVRKKNMKYL